MHFDPYAQSAPSDWEGRQRAAIRVCFEILSLCHRLEAACEWNEAYDKVLLRSKGQLDNIIWKFSEARGKYEGVRVWSVAACESVNKHGFTKAKTKVAGEEALNHEHVVPMKTMKEELGRADPLSEEQVGRLMHKYCLPAIVTIAEHRRLSNNPLPQWRDNPWCRYAKAGIKILRNPHWSDEEKQVICKGGVFIQKDAASYTLHR